jgi:hypothetical protein
VEPLRPSRVPTDVRRDAARLQGTVQRWTSSEELRDRPVEEAAEALRQITTDPIALGVALGRARAFVELDGHDTYRRAVAMLRTAGADEDTGARMLTWLRTKRQSTGEYWTLRRSRCWPPPAMPSPGVPSTGGRPSFRAGGERMTMVTPARRAARCPVGTPTPARSVSAWRSRR